MKNLFWIMIVMCFLSFMGVDKPLNVSAAMVSDSGSDDTTATANEMQLGDIISGTITESDDLDYYKFELESAGCVKLNMTSYMKYYCIKIYDADGQEVWWTTENEWTETVGYRKDAYDVYLEKGIYYMQINGYLFGNSNSYKSTGKYECITSYLSSETNNVEPDNSYADANNVALGNVIIGQISENDNYDTFKFELFQAGCVKLNMTSYMRFYNILVYNLKGEMVWSTGANEWNETVGYRKEIHNLYLEKGTYYMQVNGHSPYSNVANATGKYEIKTAFLSSNTTFNGDDNSFANAQPISWKTNYIGQISINDDFDTYKFVISTGMEVSISMTSYMQYYCIKLFDVDGKEICHTDNREWNDKVGYRKDVLGLVLSAGTYYMQINGYQYGNSNKSTGKYEFSIGTETSKADVKQEEVNQSESKNNIQSNQPSLTVKNTNTVKKPGKVKNVSVTKKKKALKLKWKKVSGAAGYQICYSTSSKFTKKSTKVATGTTITLKKLKARKNYYVKVRAYVMKDGKRVYGKYSSVVKKKTK